MSRTRIFIPTLIAAALLSACASDTPTAPAAAHPRFDGGFLGSGGGRADTTSTRDNGLIGPSGGRASSLSDDNGGLIGSGGGKAPTEGDGGWLGSGGGRSGT